jgi:hypothetical protein
MKIKISNVVRLTPLVVAIAALSVFASSPALASNAGASSRASGDTVQGQWPLGSVPGHLVGVVD